MPEPTDQKTQKTRPKKGEPVEIPVPSKVQVMADFEKIALRRTTEAEVNLDTQGADT